MKLWKRNAVVAAIVLFVCVAVYLNWNYPNDTADAGKTLGEAALVGSQTGDPMLGDSDKEEENGTGTKESGYFATARLNRQQARDSALALLQNAAAEEGADQATIDQANVSIQTMANYTVTEAQIENLVMAKGYQDCVAFIGENSISVVVSSPADGLDSSDTARIMDIIVTETGFNTDQIKIIKAE